VRCLFMCILVSQSLCFGAEHLCVRDILVPQYPLLARLAKVQGSVSLELEVENDGKIVSAKGSGPDRLLVEEAENNVRQWSFAPSTAKESARRHHTIIYVYRLEGQPVDYNPVPTVWLHLPDRVEIVTRPLTPQVDKSKPPGAIRGGPR